MSFYLFNLILLVSYTLIVKVSKYEGEKKLLFILYVIHLSTIVGIRSVNVGTDTGLYQAIFNSTSRQSIMFILQESDFILYSLLMKLVSNMFNGNYQVFLFIVAIITNFFFLIVAFKLKDMSMFLFTFFYIVLFYYFQTFNISRQFLAISICFFYFYLLTQNKKISAFIFLLIAVMIHTTALVCIVFYFLNNIVWTTKKYIFLSFFTILSLGIFENVFSIFATYFPHYDMYSGRIEDFTSGGNRIWLTIFLTLILLLGIYVSQNNTKLYPNYFYVLQSVLVISSSIGVFFYANELMVRIQFYFEVFSIIYIPLIFLKNKRQIVNNGKVSYLSLLLVPLILILFVPFFIQLRNNYGDVIPFEFYFIN